MLKIYVIEDEDAHRHWLEKIISDFIRYNYLDATLALSTASAEQILSNIDINSPSLYFIDICLGDEYTAGIQLATRLRQIHNRGGQVFIVFVTTHEKLSMLTLHKKTEPLDFIIKVNDGSLGARITECIQVSIEKIEIPHFEKPKLKIVLAGVVINVELDDILYLETTNVKHKIRVYTTNRIIEYMYYNGLKGILSDLNDERFCKVHKSYIVNFKHILSLDLKSKIITMKNKDQVLCARDKIKLVKSKI